MKKCLNPFSIGILDRLVNSNKFNINFKRLDPCSIGILYRRFVRFIISIWRGLDPNFTGIPR